MFSLGSFLLETLSNSFSSTPFLLVRRADLIVGGSYRRYHHRLRMGLCFAGLRRQLRRPQLRQTPTTTSFCVNRLTLEEGPTDKDSSLKGSWSSFVLKGVLEKSLFLLIQIPFQWKKMPPGEPPPRDRRPLRPDLVRVHPLQLQPQ